MKKDSEGNWRHYDPDDGYYWKKKENGEFEKVDQHGFRVEKD